MSSVKEEVIVENVTKLADTTKLVDVTDKLNSSLIKMIDGLEDGVAFLGAEIPEYINQLLMWNMARNLIEAVVGLVLLVAITPYLKLVWSRANNMHRTDEDAVKVFVGGGGAILLFVIGSRHINLEWLQIWIAPKVWLVEYAAALVK